MKKRMGAVMLAGLMACTMAAGLTGCGMNVKPDFEMPEGGFDTSKEVTINFYHTMGATGTRSLQAVLNDYIAEFNKIYPNIKVVHEQTGGYDDVRDQIQTEIVAGNQPNLAYCYPDHVALYNDGYAVQSLNDFLPGGAYSNEKVTLADGTQVPLALTEEEKNNFIPGYYEEGYKFDDESKMYTLPFSKSTEVLYYNKTEFEKNGWKVPTTWDEMETVCAQIQAAYPDVKNPDGTVKEHVYGFGYDSEANWFITMCEQYGSGYTSALGDHYLFDNQTNRGFVQKFAEWYNKGYFTTQAIYKTYTSGLFVATSGNRAMMCIGSSAGASHQLPDKVDGKYPFEVGIAPIPQQNPDKPKVISQGPSVCIFKNEDPQEVLASWLFLKFLTTNVGFQAEFSSASGYIPVLKEDVMRTNEVFAQTLDDANGYEGLMALSTKVALEQENSYYTSPAFVGSSKARDEVGLLMQAVFTGTKTLDKAFSDAISECEYFTT